MSAPSGSPARELDAFARAAGRIDRRGFLRGLGGAVALGALPTGCGDVAPELLPPPGPALELLSPRACAVFTAAATRLMGPEPGALIRAGRIDAARAVDGFLARAPELAGPFEQGLWLLEFGVWPLLGKLRPFTALPVEARDAVLDELMRSRLDLKRLLFQGLKSLAAWSVYASPEGMRLAAYPGPWGDARVQIADALEPGPSPRPSKENP